MYSFYTYGSGRIGYEILAITINIVFAILVKWFANSISMLIL